MKKLLVLLCALFLLNFLTIAPSAEIYDPAMENIDRINQTFALFENDLPPLETWGTEIDIMPDGSKRVFHTHYSKVEYNQPYNLCEDIMRGFPVHYYYVYDGLRIYSFRSLTTSPPQVYYDGDVDNSKIVDMQDLLLYRKFTGGFLFLPDAQCAFTDLNQDHAINLKDIYLLRKMIMNSNH